MVWWIIFAFGSIGLFLISWRALRLPGSHGFYRFFAWECILGLFVLNARYWFRSLWTWHQILSWILLCSSIPLVVIGAYQLRLFGAQNSQRDDTDTYIFEKTTRLVTVGLYGKIRHPLYSSLLSLTWGIFLKHLTWIGLILALATTGLLFLTARSEEFEN